MKCNPNLIEYFDKNKTISNIFKLVKSNKRCPNCGSKLHIHDTVEFELDKSILMLKTVYKCSDEKCNCTDKPKLEKHMGCNSNYTNDLLDKSLQLGLICNVSYEKQSEIIKLFMGVSIPQNKLYDYAKKNHTEFLKKRIKLLMRSLKA